jgi:hypothetical protein
MKLHFSLLLAALCGLASLVQLHAQSPAFSYQGRLMTDNAPATGRFDFEFSVFSAESGGTPISGPLALPGVGVTNGIFTVALNFGAVVFNGPPRWLGITVRPTGGGIITPLHPRQPITPTPYALTALSALNVPGVSGHSLHAQDGSPANTVFVDDAGRVGVGTTSPGSQFHVASRPDEAAPPRLQSTGNTRFNAGWDFYHGGTGRGYVGVPDANAPIAPGEMVLFGGANTKASVWAGQVRALTANTAGNVGIGTDTPGARLEVRGDIRLGPGGQFRATSSEENLRIVRGTVDSSGAILAGSGFQVSHTSTGSYTITFDTPFADLPTITATTDYYSYADTDSATALGSSGGTTSTQTLTVRFPGGTPLDADFRFIAIGPR